VTVQTIPDGLVFTLVGRQLRLLEPRLFLWKAASVVLLSAALFPVLAIRDGIPATIYAGALVVLHIAILLIYFYRVKFRELDPDFRALALRVLALIVVSYLLVIVSRFDPDGPKSTLVMQLLAITAFHAILLALVMIRVEPRR
jgi:low temperature requirement protein LtrA